jgi:hypothetical protein
MTSRDTSADKRLLHKIQGRLAMISRHFKVQEGTPTEPVDSAREGPSLPFLYQG